MEYLGVAQMETTNSPKRVNGAESGRWYAQISDEKYLVFLLKKLLMSCRKCRRQSSGTSNAI